MSHEIDVGSRSLPAPVFGMLTLPLGIQSGFVSVTLGFVLSHHGFSVSAVAGLIGLNLLPSTWRFLVGPFIDVSLTPRFWYLLSSGLLSLSLLAVALVPLEFVTVTFTVPLPEGAMAEIDVALLTVNEVALVPPNFTLVAPI